MKAKKNEPFSSIGQRRVQVIQKEVPEIALPTLALEGARIASLTISIEEITPRWKRRKIEGKGKEKVDVSVWDDTRVALMRAHNFVTLVDLKKLFGVPSHEIMNRHMHKLVQVLLGLVEHFF